MYYDILLHADQSNAFGLRMETAATLASRFQAHLTGLFVIPDIIIPSYAEVQIGQELIDAGLEAAREQAEICRQTFTRVVEKHGLKGEWRQGQGEIAAVLALHARYADLVIVGQSDESDPYDENSGLADRLVLSAGRPVLVTPYVGDHEQMGKEILLAWNAGRESARAVHDAMPLLRAAKQVHVVCVNPEQDPSAHGDIPGADIALHLARHSVEAEVHHFVARDIDVADMLLNKASDFNVDLIVMGAYGHSRLRETILGGATRSMLDHSPVPLLLSH